MTWMVCAWHWKEFNMNEIQMTSIAGAKVLIVDDTPANIGVLLRILENEGYQALAATSGESALKIVHQTQVELIILDIMMPGIDGLETCRRLKMMPATRMIPVIFVTALNDTVDLIEGFRAGAVDYINKPFRHEEVCVRVRMHLQMCKYLNAYRFEAERLRAIMTNMAEGLLLITPDGKIRSGNPAAHNLLGYTVGELAQCSLLDLLAPPFNLDYAPYFMQNIGSPVGHVAALPHGPQEVMLHSRSGADVSLDLTMTRIFADEPLYVGFLHDISAHKQSHDELVRIASIDPLTNLANRRQLDTVLKQEWNRAQRLHSPISLAMIDVDYFKAYNDSLGHPAGDNCLQQVAQAIRSIIHRPTDLAARFGGEEFVLLFAGTELENAQQLAEKTRCAVEAMALPHPASQASAVITVSIGVASLLPDKDSPISELLNMADAALYQAKRAGRNRVVCAR
jgi:two-component system, cell cycle response regulator